MEKTLGGDRLGAGNKMKVHLHNYERSTHDTGYTWRSTMAAGTLVPFMSKLALPGDTWDINLGCDVMTHPTIGPLFGSYKVQLDLFKIPLRLYMQTLHMNALNIGLNMKDIYIPQVKIKGKWPLDTSKPIDNQQINSSCLFSYLGIRGIGLQDQAPTVVARPFNAIPFISYYDIYKQYYANKQEEYAYIIHTAPGLSTPGVAGINTINPSGMLSWEIDNKFHIAWTSQSMIEIESANEVDPEYCMWEWWDGVSYQSIPLSDVWSQIHWNDMLGKLICENMIDIYRWVPTNVEINRIYWTGNQIPIDGKPHLQKFPLTAIDDMREYLLTQSNKGAPVVFDYNTTHEPYKYPLQWANVNGAAQYSCLSTQEGLAIKTYNSDLFNNWLNSEFIEGPNSIAEVTALATNTGSITIDEIALSTKVYKMLNRIAVSGGTYDDWLDAVYTHDRFRSQENPAYMGGLIKELVFQEVISTAESGDQKLGSLAGRGVMASKHKGGRITIKVDEPSYIMGIVSITPRIDYSQGNSWDMNLRTMDDLHKPALDEIGFQDLITDQMAWFDTPVNSSSAPLFNTIGKQPAWVNYMTSVNEVRGNFADPDNQMFMTLNRRYEFDWNTMRVKDLTTYIDPSKFNYIFADTRLDAQNFWVQIGINATARRKMSARIMPNL